MKRGEFDLDSALRVLETQGWFSQRSNATRDLLGEIAKLRSYSKDERIYLAGDRPNGIYGLVRGSLNVAYQRADGENFTAHRAGVGVWFGALATFAGQDRLTSVYAAEPSVLVHLPLQDITRLTREDPRLYADFYSITYENFQTSLRVIANLALTSTEHRLADRLLLDLESRGDDEGWIPVSQTELAKLLAISLPTLQRVMRRFVNAGILHSSYGHIRVVERAALEKICAGEDL